MNDKGGIVMTTKDSTKNTNTIGNKILAIFVIWLMLASVFVMFAGNENVNIGEVPIAKELTGQETAPPALGAKGGEPSG